MLVFLVKITIQLIRFVPFGMLYALSGWVCFSLKHVIRYRRQVIKSNLKNAFPEKEERQIQELCAKFYRNFSDILLESIKGLTLPKAELQRRFVYKNPRIFHALFEKGQSAILLGSHVGNWEWGVLSFPLVVKHQVVGVYKPLKNKRLDRLLHSLRQRWGLQLTDMAKAGRAIAENKGKPTIFVFIGDQTPADVRNAHWLNFLHQDTPFLHGMDKLARQTGYPVFYFEIKRVQRGHYEVMFSELWPTPAPPGDGQITQLFATRLENDIKNSPSDWLWSHRRWKRKRPG